MQNTSSSPRGISWHQPPRSGGSAGGGGGRRRGGVRPAAAAAAGGRRKGVSPSQLQHPQQQQYQNQQPQQQHDRPRDEVLDSSSSSEDEGDRGECNDKGKSARMSAGFDDIRREDNNYWQGKGDRGDGDEGETEASSPASDDNADEDDDDEEQFMNPYIMKPHFLMNNNTPPQPPPPPTMELTSIMSWRSSSSTASTQATTKESTICSNREKSSALMGFDPYSPGRDQTQQQQYQTQQHQQTHRHYPMQHEMEWEMEIEESTIDFTQQQQTQQQQNSKDDIDNLFHNSNPHREPNRNDQGGGEIGVRSSGENDDYLYDTSFSASFSPVPKHHHHQQQLGPQDYGEKTPLFGCASSSSSSSTTSTQFPHHPFLPHRGPIFNAHTPFSSVTSSSSSSGQWRTRIRQNIPPLVVGASNAILSVLYYASRTASILLNSDGGEERNTSNTNHHHHSSTTNNARMPLLSASRFPEKFRNNDSRRYFRWNTIKSFRLLLLAMTAVLCMRTISIMMWSLPSDAEMSSSTTTTTIGVGIVPDAMTTAAHQQQLSEHQQSIVNKMKKAKAHWWSRKKVESSSTSSEKVVAPPAEVYRDGKKEDVQTIVIPEQGEVVVQGENHNTAVDVNNESTKEEGGHSSAAAAVIVQTEEDGTILIKLPPPKLSLEEPNKSFGSAIIDGNEEENERLYIKLPYQPQHPQEEMATEKREIEPPLRGAAPQETQHPHSSTMMRRRLPPPPLLTDHEHHHHPASHHHHGFGGNNRHLHDEHDHPNVLHALRKEFETWMSKHGKQYGSKKEEEHRFNVWRTNHARIAKKNERHGPCRMTGKAVFGHNLFSDLDPEEFQSKFLTGYRGPRHSSSSSSSSSSVVGSGTIDAAAVLRPSYFRDTKRIAESPSPITGASLIKRHPSIQRKLDEVITMYGAGGFGDGGNSSNNSQLHGTKFQSNYGSRCSTWWDISCYRNNGVKWSNGCQWWDVSCVLRYIFGYQYMGGTREPVYDESSYPSVLDWRTLGVVTDVNSQGACGACWAITAVETIESANAIATGQLIDLDEEEVIACDGTCEMCNGGWPQNAYEYVMKHGGLPVKTSDYNADWLYLVTAVLAGESYDVSQDQLSGYFAQTCPAGVREGDSGEARGDNKNGGDHHSGDEQQQQYASSYVASARYGKVKGYGYATDRCVCYTDGSGCDCDNQDEKTAVLNVASYGPAAVCLEASLWQNYEGGIMTSDIGCSSGFLDMNHCVEVVGYAFTDEGSSSNGGGGGSRDDKSHKSGSRDSSTREGYWIVKNQWSTYWGMGGYAYLAMGDNTCGILNDMTQVYMK